MHAVRHRLSQERCLRAQVGTVIRLYGYDQEASKPHQAEAEDQRCNQHFKQE